MMKMMIGDCILEEIREGEKIYEKYDLWMIYVKFWNLRFLCMDWIWWVEIEEENFKEYRMREEK